MSTTYSTQPGDTFESIAKRLYGDVSNAEVIRAANPDVSEPIQSGLTLTVPQTQPATPVTSADPDQVTLTVGGQQVTYWTELTLSQSIDTFSQVTLAAPFDTELPGFKEVFRPFSYSPVTVYIGAALVFTGVVVNVTPVLTADSKTVVVECYAKTALINDCSASAGSFPIEFNGLTLQQIAERVLKPFSVTPVFDVDSGAAFERVALRPESTIFSFLRDLAEQRNIVMSSNESGDTVFTRAATSGQPVAVLAQGEQPLLSVQPAFQPQQFYSHITGFESVKLGSSGAKYTVKNPHLNGVLRPHNFTAKDGEVRTATQSKAGQMFGSVVAYTVDVVGWRTKTGELFRPNTIVSLLAPDAMVYSTYNLVVTDVTFNKNADRYTASLRLALPGSFSGEIPESLPWDD